MAFYEHVLIARPDISPAQVETLMEELSSFLGEQGAKVEKTEYWGLRNLAYPINKQRKGHYSLFNIDGPAAAIHELERQHRISDDVMRYMTIRVDELDEGPSPILSRKDRGDRSERSPRREDERG
ncbi:MAG: 30S ribosomal protein S6 [Pseudomonadota bacterium]